VSSEASGAQTYKFEIFVHDIEGGMRYSPSND
jgi:hypothetical protein